MKVAYKKVNQITLFGFKILEFKSDYIEHSIDNDDDDDSLFISLEKRVVEGSK